MGVDVPDDKALQELVDLVVADRGGNRAFQVLGRERIHAILEGLGWVGAFERGWEVLKANIGPTIIFWLIFLVIGLVIAVVVGGTVLAAVVPFAALFATTAPGPWIAAPLCFGGLLAVLVFALIGSIVETFTSATWTLAYREMMGLAAPAASEE